VVEPSGTAGVKGLTSEQIRETCAELDVARLLSQLIVVLQPRLIVETGCFIGRTTLSLARAAWSCGGRVISCDIDENYLRLARACCHDYLVHPLRVEIRLCRGIDLPELREADFVFIDSAYADRKEELLATKAGAVVLIHDTARSYDAGVEPLGDWVRSLGGICLPTERGLGILIR
jgi:predicted O-methyltransferase YrrM